MELTCYTLSKLQLPEVGAGGRVVVHRASPTSRPGPLWFGSPRAAHGGCELVKKAQKPVGLRRSRECQQPLGSPVLLPSAPSGAAGNYLLKHRPRSHLFAVNNPRHLSAFIKPFPSPRPHYFNNKSRVTFRRHY